MALQWLDFRGVGDSIGLATSLFCLSETWRRVSIVAVTTHVYQSGSCESVSGSECGVARKIESVGYETTICQPAGQEVDSPGGALREGSTRLLVGGAVQGDGYLVMYLHQRRNENCYKEAGGVNRVP